MSTFVAVNTYTHSVTYVTDKLLTSMKVIIRLSGLSPAKLAGQWETLERGIKRWLETQHLEQVLLEVFDPQTSTLVGRWDLAIGYGFQGDGSFWIDPDTISYAIQKQGVLPATCDYRIVTTTKPGRPDVDGWSSVTLLSTAGFVHQGVGTAIDGSGLTAAAGYWRKVSS